MYFSVMPFHGSGVENVFISRKLISTGKIIKQPLWRVDTLQGFLCLSLRRT